MIVSAHVCASPRLKSGDRADCVAFRFDASSSFKASPLSLFRLIVVVYHCYVASRMSCNGPTDLCVNVRIESRSRESARSSNKILPREGTVQRDR